MIAALVILWCIGVAVLVIDLDREQTAMVKVSSKIRPLTQDEEAVAELYRQRDRAKVASMRSTRIADQQAWEIRRHEAEHIAHVRRLRRLWDGLGGVRFDAEVRR